MVCAAANITNQIRTTIIALWMFILFTYHLMKSPQKSFIIPCVTWMWISERLVLNVNVTKCSRSKLATCGNFKGFAEKGWHLTGKFYLNWIKNYLFYSIYLFHLFSMLQMVLVSLSPTSFASTPLSNIKLSSAIKVVTKGSPTCVFTGPTLLSLVR